MAVDKQDFGEEIGWVDEARKEDKTEKVLTGPLDACRSTWLDFFGLLVTEVAARPIAHSLSTKRRGGDCWGGGSILRLCHRRYHHGYALAEDMERGVVVDKQRVV